MHLTASTLDTAYKVQIFEKLAKQVDVDLGKKGYNVYRDAIAFLVEGMTMIYPADQSKVMLEGIVEKIAQNPKEARVFLDKQISTLYQAILANKIDAAPAEEKKSWESLNRIYAGFMQIREQNYTEGKPAEFGGINRSLLPSWYKEKYVQEAL